MANIKSAKKRIRVIDKKTARNRRVKNHLKTILKNFEQAMEEGNLEVAQEKLHLAEKKLMQAAAKNTISKHAASRKDSTLQRQQNKSHPSPPVHKLNAQHERKTMEVSPMVFILP